MDVQEQRFGARCRYAVLAALLASACSGADEPDASARDGGPSRDAASVDAGSQDGGASRDAGAGADAGAREDGGDRDAGIAGTGTWSTGPSLPEPRQETAVVALRGEVYVIAGYGTRGFHRDVTAFDPTTDRWRAVAELPVDMHHANAVVYDDKIYVLGYLVGGFQDEGRVFVYDPDLDAWDEETAMPSNRSRGSSVVVESGGLFYVIGGLKNGAATGDVDRYDPIAKTWSPLPPIPRLMDHGAGGAHDGRLYVAGGRTGAIDNHVADLDVFDIATSTWTKGPDMPTGRGGTAGVMVAGRLYVFGGEGNSENPPTNLFADVEAYDVARDAWEVLTPMMPAKHGTGAAMVGGRIYVPGGATVVAFGAVDTLSVFDP